MGRRGDAVDWEGVQAVQTRRSLPPSCPPPGGRLVIGDGTKRWLGLSVASRPGRARQMKIAAEEGWPRRGRERAEEGRRVLWFLSIQL